MIILSFLQVSYLTPMNYIDTIADEIENRLSDFKKIKGEIAKL